MTVRGQVKAPAATDGTPATATCAEENCHTQHPSQTCWCDNLCDFFQDCCEGFVFADMCSGPEYGLKGECTADNCGSFSGVDCWCDTLCTSYGDCCPNYDDICAARHVSKKASRLQKLQRLLIKTEGRSALHRNATDAATTAGTPPTAFSPTPPAGGPPNATFTGDFVPTGTPPGGFSPTGGPGANSSGGPPGNFSPTGSPPGDFSPTGSPPGDWTPTGAPGTTTGEGSCTDQCGSSSTDCWCDSLCTGFGDCCPDFTSVCDPEDLPDVDWGWGPPAAADPDAECTESECGGYHADGGCWCDILCTFFGDCCQGDAFVYADVCGELAGTCKGNCDSFSGADCWCDSWCEMYGDCCTDYSAMCLAKHADDGPQAKHGDDGPHAKHGDDGPHAKHADDGPHAQRTARVAAGLRNTVRKIKKILE